MIKVELTESQHSMLIRYLDEQAHKTIHEQRAIKEAAADDWDANDRAQINSLTARLKWFNNIINTLSKGKKI